MGKRRPLLTAILIVSMLLLAACTRRHTEYLGVAMDPAMSGELQWDRSGSTATGLLTLGGGSESRTGLPPGGYDIALTFSGAAFTGVITDIDRHEFAKASGTVTATGVDLTVTTPQRAPFTITFKSTKSGAYTHPPEY
jgi:hypothetical protein